VTLLSITCVLAVCNWAVLTTGMCYQTVYPLRKLHTTHGVLGVWHGCHMPPELRSSACIATKASLTSPHT
jgi:hypothetical protein